MQYVLLDDKKSDSSVAETNIMLCRASQIRFYCNAKFSPYTIDTFYQERVYE